MTVVKQEIRAVPEKPRVFV